MDSRSDGSLTRSEDLVLDELEKALLAEAVLALALLLLQNHGSKKLATEKQLVLDSLTLSSKHVAMYGS